MCNICSCSEDLGFFFHLKSNIFLPPKLLALSEIVKTSFFLQTLNLFALSVCLQCLRSEVTAVNSLLLMPKISNQKIFISTARHG